MARPDWAYIPTETLEKQKRDEDAALWATQQRKALAQSWADAHLADFQQNLPDLTPQMPPGPFHDPHLEGLSGGPDDPGTGTPAPQAQEVPPGGTGVLGFDSAKTAGRIEENAPPVQTDEGSNDSPYPTSLGDAFKRGMDQGTGQSPDIPPLPTDFGPFRTLPGMPNKPTQPPQETTDKILSDKPIDAQDFVSSLTKASMNQGTSPAFAEGMPGIKVGTSEEEAAARALGGTEKALGAEGPEATARAAYSGGAAEIGAATKKADAAEAARLRLDKFPEPVRDTIQQAAESGDFWKTQRRGVIPDAEAEKMADDLGLSVDQIIAKGKAGKSYTAEETRAIRNAYVAQAMKVNDLAAEIAAAPHRAGDELIAQAAAEGAKLADLSKVAEGARAEAGRTLRSYQAFARDYAADPVAATGRIVKALGGREEAMRALDSYQRLVQSGADAFKMADFWAKVEKPPPGFSDWFTLLRYNAMLSGPRTLEVNVLGNALEVPWRLARDTAASVLRGQPQEIGPEVAGMVEGARKGIGSFMDVLTHGVTAEQAAAGEIPRNLSARLSNPGAKGAAKALELPGNVLQAADEFARQAAYGMGLGRWAATSASHEGLKGQAWSRRVEEFLASPPPEAMKGAEAIAERMTYKGEMGSLGQGIEGFRSKTGIVGNIVVPFLRTVYHITSRGIDRSPLGPLGTTVDVARGVYGDVNPMSRTGRSNLRDQLGGTAAPRPGVVPLGERVGDNAMGAFAFAAMSMAAANGYISGAGSEDREKRDMSRAQGWQPYSIKLGNRWVSYANWGPIAVPLSMAAAQAEGGGNPLDTFKRGAQVLTEQAYLQGIGVIYKALTQPDRYGEQWVAQALQTLVPYGAAINTAGQATDPLMRDPGKTTVDQLGRGEVPNTLKARIPGVRESLPAQQDQLGRDVPNEQRGLAAVLPVRASSERPSAALQALREVGVDVPEPPKEVRSIPLTPEEQRAFNKRAGELIEQRVMARRSDGGWADRSPESKRRILAAAVESARKDAGNEIYAQMKTLPGAAQRRQSAKDATTAKQLATR